MSIVTAPLVFTFLPLITLHYPVYGAFWAKFWQNFLPDNLTVALENIMLFTGRITKLSPRKLSIKLKSVRKRLMKVTFEGNYFDDHIVTQLLKEMIRKKITRRAEYTRIIKRTGMVSHARH